MILYRIIYYSAWVSLSTRFLFTITFLFETNPESWTFIFRQLKISKRDLNKNAVRLFAPGKS